MRHCHRALEEGWKPGMDHAMADGIMTRAEESKLREFRDRLALDAGAADPESTAQLEKSLHRPADAGRPSRRTGSRRP